MFGTAVIVFFIIFAVIGPSFAPYDPLNPCWPGYYPAQPPPIIGYPLSVPAWYAHLPGGENLVQSFTVVQDHEFSSKEVFFEKWDIIHSNPELTSVEWNPTEGVHHMRPPSAVQERKNDACIQISYKASKGQSRPFTMTVRLDYKFLYPYRNPPRSFWIHASYLVKDAPGDMEIYLDLSFYRIGAIQKEDYVYDPNYITEEDGIKIYHYPLTSRDPRRVTPTGEWVHFWTRSTDSIIFENPLWYRNPTPKIFPEAGTYVLSVKVIFQDASLEERNVDVYLDNVDVLVYGDTHGILGTDYNLGKPRDNLTSLIYGARVSLMVGLLSAIISVSIGLVVGLISGYVGGLVDEVLMRFTDLLLTLPGLPLLIVLVSVLKPSIWNVIWVLSFLGWMGFARNVRSMTLSLRERAFVEAAKAAGAGKLHIMFKHIMPNVFALVYLALAVSVPGAIVAEASLSYLGLFDPTIITWGRMFNEFQNSGVAALKGVQDYWFWFVPPGVAISLLSISFILMGYALDDILNPRLRMRR